MNENQANKLLSPLSNYLFDNNSTVVHLAVIMLMNDNGFAIEIGYNGNDSSAIEKIVESFLEKESIDFPINENDIKLREEIPYVSLLEGCDEHPNPFKDKVQSPNGGCSIINNLLPDTYSGTMGATFKLKNHEGNFFISNYHVLTRIKSKSSKSKRFETILHPSKADSHDIYIDYNPIGNLFWYNMDENMDAAIGKASCPNSVSGGIRCIEGFRIKGVREPEIDMEVKKCGRSTGLTNGVVTSINCTVRIKDIRFSEYPNSSKIFKNQILTDCMASGGDSGSILINKEDNKAIGLTFAGNKINTSYHNNLNQIFNSKNVICNRIIMPEIEFKEFI